MLSTSTGYFQTIIPLKTNNIKILSTLKLLKSYYVGKLSTSFKRFIKKVEQTFVNNCLKIDWSKNIVNTSIAPETS